MSLREAIHIYMTLPYSVQVKLASKLGVEPNAGAFTSIQQERDMLVAVFKRAVASAHWDAFCGDIEAAKKDCGQS